MRLSNFGMQCFGRSVYLFRIISGLEFITILLNNYMTAFARQPIRYHSGRSIPFRKYTDLFDFDTLLQILSITNLYVLLFIFYLPPTRLSTNRPFAHSHTNTDQWLNMSTSMPVEEINLIFKQMLCSMY